MFVSIKTAGCLNAKTEIAEAVALPTLGNVINVSTEAGSAGSFVQYDGSYAELPANEVIVNADGTLTKTGETYPDHL